LSVLAVLAVLAVFDGSVVVGSVRADTSDAVGSLDDAAAPTPPPWW